MKAFFLLVVIVGTAAALLGGGGTGASFLDAPTSDGNALVADNLDAPTGLTATGNVTLDWTATADIYASGHRVFRSSTSGGPYSQIAQVTPRTNTTYADNPGPGTHYYVVRAYYQNWESANSNQASATVSPPGIQLVGTPGSATSAGAVTSLSWSHTVPSGSNRILVVAISLRKHNMSVSNLTYGGTGGFVFVGTQIGGGPDHRVEIWYKLAPAIGTATISATFSGGPAVEAIGGSVSFDGVNQTTPTGTFVGAQGTGTAPSRTISSTTGEMVIDVLSASGDSGIVNAGGGQTQRWSGSTGTGDGNEFGSGSTEAGAASVTMSWSLTNSNRWALGAVALKPAP